MPNGFGSEIEKVERVYKDMYFGNGKPGITTRMAAAEEKIETQGKSISDVKKMFWAIVILLLTLLGTTVAEIAKTHDEPQPHSYNDFR